MSRLVESIDALDNVDKKKYIDWYLSVAANDFVCLSNVGKVKYVVGEYLALINWSEDVKKENSKEA